MDNKTALIPLDGDHPDARAKITESMKGLCIGEFEFEIDEPCPKCAYHLDREYGDHIKCLCNGSDEKMYRKSIVVPWDTTKEIYQEMASIAMWSCKKEEE